MILKFPTIIFGVAYPWAFAIGVVRHVKSAPRFSAAFAFWEFVCKDNADSLH